MLLLVGWWLFLASRPSDHQGRGVKIDGPVIRVVSADSTSVDKAGLLVLLDSGKIAFAPVGNARHDLKGRRVMLVTVCNSYYPRRPKAYRFVGFENPSDE